MTWSRCTDKPCYSANTVYCTLCNQELTVERSPGYDDAHAVGAKGLHVNLHKDGHWEHICGTCVASITSAAMFAILNGRE